MNLEPQEPPSVSKLTKIYCVEIATGVRNRFFPPQIRSPLSLMLTYCVELDDPQGSRYMTELKNTELSFIVETNRSWIIFLYVTSI